VRIKTAIRLPLRLLCVLTPVTTAPVTDPHRGTLPAAPARGYGTESQEEKAGLRRLIQPPGWGTFE